ncbi:MAG: 2-amino-4-hydroxy-6-hydroxymethyldihydropteridine diphosphokinase [Polyangiaceae bacterium]
MDHIRRVVLGLGSNVGDRVKNLNEAIAALRKDRDMHVLSVSPFYETDAVPTPEWKGPPQPKFVNGAVLVLTSLPAAEMLERMLVIEKDLGRERTVPSDKGPRTIDLDLLWIEGEAVDEPGLRVPHPRLRERAFALRPLLDLASDARDEQGAAYADCPEAKTALDKI